MLDERDPTGVLQVRWPWDSTEPHIEEGDLDYTGAKVSAQKTVGYLHGLGRIFGAALRAGLTITRFSEGDRIPWKALDQLVQVQARLGWLREGDSVRLEAGGVESEYRFVRRRIVKPEQIAVAGPTRQPQLTLITCYPFDWIGAAPYRLIWEARPVGPSPPATAANAASAAPAVQAGKP